MFVLWCPKVRSGSLRNVGIAQPSLQPPYHPESQAPAPGTNPRMRPPSRLKTGETGLSGSNLPRVRSVGEMRFSLRPRTSAGRMNSTYPESRAVGVRSRYRDAVDRSDGVRDGSPTAEVHYRFHVVFGHRHAHLNHQETRDERFQTRLVASRFDLLCVHSSFAAARMPVRRRREQRRYRESRGRRVHPGMSGRGLFVLPVQL